MTPEQAFRTGFLLWCAEQGMDGKEIRAAARKAAAYTPEMTKRAVFGVGEAINLLGKGGRLAYLTALGLPVVAGAVGGYATAKATGSDRADLVDEAKSHELISEYQRLAEDAKRRTQLRELQRHLQSYRPSVR